MTLDLHSNYDIHGECYCVDITLKLCSSKDFQIDYATKCYYRFNKVADTFSVFMNYDIIPYSKITGEINVPLYLQYNLSTDKFYKHFRTLGEWRQEKIDSIIYD